MSGLTRVNQRLAGERATPSPVLYAPSQSAPASGRGSPGAGYASSGSGAGGGPAYGGGPGSGFPAGAGGSYASGSGYAASARHAGARKSSPPNRPSSAQSQYSESPYGGGMSSDPGSVGGWGKDRTAYELETHNDDRLSGLLGKVEILKNITTGIGNEVRDGNRELEGMNDTFGSTANYLKGTWRRMNTMARRQGSNWCWFMLFLLVVFWIFMLVWWFRR